MDPIGFLAETEEIIRRMRIWEFFYKPQDVSSEPNETTNELGQSTERSAVQRPKKKLDPSGRLLPQPRHVYSSCQEMRDFYCLPKTHKANTTESPIVSGNGTLSENLSGYVEGILNPIIFIQKHGTAMGTRLAPQYANIFMHSLQHVINDDEHLAKIIPTPPLLAFKQLLNLKQTIVHSKLLSLHENINHNTTKPCHGNLCKTCQIINMDAAIT
eukprot:g46628.t1